MTPKLYEMADEYVAFSNVLEATPTDDPEAEASVKLALATIHGSFLAKTDNIAALVKEYESASTVLDEEMARLKARQRTYEAKAAWLRSYLLENMNRLDMDHAKTSRYNVSVQHTTAVEITDESALPARFQKQIVTYKPDKVAIRRAIMEDGEQVDGAALVVNEHLRIT